MCVRCGTGRIAWCTDPDRHEGQSGDNYPRPTTEQARQKLAFPRCRNCDRCLDQCGCTGEDFRDWMSPEDVQRIIAGAIAATRQRRWLDVRSAVNYTEAELDARLRQLLEGGVMSKTLFEQDGLLVTLYCGPERADGGDRMRVQLSDLTEQQPYEAPEGMQEDTSGYLTLSAEQWRAVCIAASILGPDLRKRP